MPCRYTLAMPRRDPHDVLGVPRDAGQATIKAAWRRLAREHHPDVVSADPAAARIATRRMAEINRAYEELRAAAAGISSPEETAGNGHAHWPPRPRPTRPVTGRLDTSATYRPRNATIGPRVRHVGHQPGYVDRLTREPLRASQPTGPLARARQRGFRAPARPTLADALAWPIEFGKFHGHTLGEIANFEPSYIDWLAQTISRDPDLVAAARVIQEDLDLRSIVRRPHASTARPA
jgi:DnaJ domain/Exodeoxyribonuclease X-like C-terminal